MQKLEKILIIGPRFNKKYPDIMGGAIVLFEELINQFDKNKINYVCIDTSKKKYKNLLFAYISVTFQILFKHKGCSHISLHSSSNYIFWGPIIILVGKLFNKKTSLRKFGGEAADTYKKNKNIKKSILKFIFSHIDTLFFETKYLVNFFSKINKNTFWFPNVRSRKIYPKIPRVFHKNLLFIGHIKHEKGIDEILEASSKIDSSYTIDLYGPISEKKYTKKFFEKYNAQYKGILPSDKVLEILNKYDVVLLPSYKEGYPGIVIEGLSLGIPVITTTLPSIKEMIDDFHTGVLIEPGNVDQLVKAIKYFTDENYTFMSEKAYQKFDDFNADIQTKLFLERLSDV